MNIETVIKTLLKYHPKADTDMVRLAYDFAETAHHGQTRLTGEPYIIHSLATALNLAEMRLPETLIVAGLLHDVPEDTEYTLSDIKKNFGDEVATLVKGITKLGTLKYRGMDRYAENLRKMFLAMAEDIRVILVKFADRLHNLETLDAQPEHKKKRIALESLEIFAPLANRLGMGEIKGRIEDLAFKHLQPEEYAWTEGLIAARLPTLERHLERAKHQILADLKAAHIKVISAHGRVKHLFSLYKKIIKYEKDIAKVHDVVALRIMVPTISDCYAALGIIHARWKPLKGRIKDYIAQPKPNGYQSLHTTVFCDEEAVEFQIRTPEMHDAAEFGIAAHWQYDEADKKSRLGDRKVKWVEDLAKIQRDMEDQKTFMKSLDTLKVDVFQSRIFVFTPKGDVIDLPEGATPVDFAYAIHSDIGRTCVGARINDALVSLDTELHSGDVIEIVTDKNRKGPSADWLKFAKTHRARTKIKEESRGLLSGFLETVTSAAKKPFKKR